MFYSTVTNEVRLRKALPLLVALVVAMAGLTALTVVPAAAVDPLCTAAPLTYTGAGQTCPIPAGVNVVKIVARGGGGSSYTTAAGGVGGAGGSGASPGDDGDPASGGGGGGTYDFTTLTGTGGGAGSSFATPNPAGSAETAFAPVDPSNGATAGSVNAGDGQVTFTTLNRSTILAATPGSGRVTVDWDQPAQPAGVGTVTQQVYKDGFAVDGATSSGAVITGLNNGQSHAFTVVAFTAAGLRSTSPVVNATPVAGPATYFTVTAPASATAGSAFNYTVTALDAFNNTVTATRAPCISPPVTAKPCCPRTRR